jgi:hypothetical protein
MSFSRADAGPLQPLCTAWGKPCGPAGQCGGQRDLIVGRAVDAQRYDRAHPQALHRSSPLIHNLSMWPRPIDLHGRQLSTASTAPMTTSLR